MEEMNPLIKDTNDEIIHLKNRNKYIYQSTLTTVLTIIILVLSLLLTIDFINKNLSLSTNLPLSFVHDKSICEDPLYRFYYINLSILLLY